MSKHEWKKKMNTKHILLFTSLAMVVACGAQPQNIERDRDPMGNATIEPQPQPQPQPQPEQRVEYEPVSADEDKQTTARNNPVPVRDRPRQEVPRLAASKTQLAEVMAHDLAAITSNVAAPRIARRAMLVQPQSPSYQDYGRENYQSFDNNGVHWAAQDPVSTFSIDVDTASYANVRRILNHGQLPQPDAVRVEELVNYFSYDYPKAQGSETPFSIYTEMGPSPWDVKRQLLHVGINGWQPDERAELPPANLVFLIDVSGSMQAPNKIDLLKSAMKLMVKQLRPQDRLSIAVYAGSSGEVLAPTAGDQRATIHAALDRLHAGGSTNGGAGIRLAYNMARQNFIKDGVNRVILATDGDFNVGTTDIGALERLVEQERKSGVALTVLGFGTGNYNDHLMQKIAQIGDGNAAYIDTLNEARKVLVDELGATLNTIAKDVKIQIEFNPQLVESYRLIGYETRHLNREDFNNDQVDAGEIGAGHTVTALYELTLTDGEAGLVDPLRYGNAATETQGPSGAELAFLKLRYKAPTGERSRLIKHPLYRSALLANLAKTSEDYRFSAAVAWLGQLLRNNTSIQDGSIKDVIELAQGSRGTDQFGYRSEFINLARTAEALSLVSFNDHNARIEASENRG
jgi:Ca-activated chloride channel family protein